APLLTRQSGLRRPSPAGLPRPPASLPLTPSPSPNRSARPETRTRQPACRRAVDRRSRRAGVTTVDMTPIYSTTVHATGDGRNGHVSSDDGIIDLGVLMPKELGGAGGATNPEQLFAAGYAACFHSALRLVAGPGARDATHAATA